MSNAIRTTDDGIVFELADGSTVEVMLVGHDCIGFIDDGYVGFEDDEHQTIAIHER